MPDNRDAVHFGMGASGHLLDRDDVRATSRAASIIWPRQPRFCGTSTSGNSNERGLLLKDEPSFVSSNQCLCFVCFAVFEKSRGRCGLGLSVDNSGLISCSGSTHRANNTMRIRSSFVSSSINCLQLIAATGAQTRPGHCRGGECWAPVPLAPPFQESVVSDQ